MHRSLHIRELVDRILKLLAPNYDSSPWSTGQKEGFGDVCAISRTCRLLQEPALNILWYCQSTSVHLLKCLPSDLWYVQEVEKWQGSRLLEARFYFTNSRPISPEDWYRVDFYARRVVKFWALSGSVHPRMQITESQPQDVYDLLRASKGRSLLPNLRYIQAQLIPPAIGLRLLHAVASPSIQSITISLTMSPNLTEELSTLSVSCPSIHTLRLSISNEGVDLQGLPRVLQVWHHLRYVTMTLNAVTRGNNIRQLLSELWSMPRMDQLNLTLTHRGRDHGTQTVDLDIPFVFNDLTNITVRGRLNDASVESILKDCRFPSLLSYHGDITHVMFPAFAGLLKTSVTTDTFKSLRVTLFEAKNPSFLLGYTALQPLMCFHNLESLCISGQAVNLELSDHHWEILARGWPRLRLLQIQDDTESNGVINDKPTFRSLAHLVRHCPQLYSVQLTLRDEHVTDTAELDSLPTSVHLTELHLWRTTFQDLHPPATWIAKMFPHLEVLTRVEPLQIPSGGMRWYGTVSLDSPSQWAELLDLARAAVGACVGALA